MQQKTTSKEHKTAQKQHWLTIQQNYDHIQLIEINKSIINQQPNTDVNQAQKVIEDLDLQIQLQEDDYKDQDKFLQKYKNANQFILALKQKLSLEMDKKEALNTKEKSLTLKIEKLNGELEYKNQIINDLEQRFNQLLEQNSENLQKDIKYQLEQQQLELSQNSQVETDLKTLLEKYKQKNKQLKLVNQQLQNDLERLLIENKQVRQTQEKLKLESLDLNQQLNIENQGLKNQLIQQEHDFNLKIDDLKQLLQYQSLFTNSQSNKNNTHNQIIINSQDSIKFQQNKGNKKDEIEINEEENDNKFDQTFGFNEMSQIWNSTLDYNYMTSNSNNVQLRLDSILDSLKGRIENEAIWNLKNQISNLQQQLIIERQNNKTIQNSIGNENSFKTLYQQLLKRYWYEVQNYSLQLHQKNQEIISMFWQKEYIIEIIEGYEKELEQASAQ